MKLAYLRASGVECPELVAKDGDNEPVVIPLTLKQLWRLHNESGVYLDMIYREQERLRGDQ